MDKHEENFWAFLFIVCGFAAWLIFLGLEIHPAMAKRLIGLIPVPDERFDACGSKRQLSRSVCRCEHKLTREIKMKSLRALVLPTTMMLGLLAACTDTGPAKNPYAAGSTGQTVVPGNNSSIAGDSVGTTRSQTGSPAGGGSGGGSGK